jgi:hypothetical protein
MILKEIKNKKIFKKQEMEKNNNNKNTHNP